MHLMLVRHGETISNIRHQLDSRPPGPGLTELGRRQAAALADRLAGEPVVAVYASTATRAQETAEPVAREHGMDVAVLDGVHELFVGDLEMRSDPQSIGQFAEVFRSWTAGELSVGMPGGETGWQVRDRYLRAVEWIRSRHPTGLVVLVSHGGVIRLAAEWFTDNVNVTQANLGLLPNTGHIRLGARAGEPGWHCLEWTGLDLSSRTG